MSDKFNLDRETNINESICANGKKWRIHFNRTNGLCYTRPDPDRSDAVIPDELRGQWTKPSLLQPLITKYVTQTWDKADEAKAKAARKATAKKEAPKKVEAKSDEGSSTD